MELRRPPRRPSKSPRVGASSPHHAMQRIGEQQAQHHHLIGAAGPAGRGVGDAEQRSPVATPHRERTSGAEAQRTSEEESRALAALRTSSEELHLEASLEEQRLERQRYRREIAAYHSEAEELWIHVQALEQPLHQSSALDGRDAKVHHWEQKAQELAMQLRECRQAEKAADLSKERLRQALEKEKKKAHEEQLTWESSLKELREASGKSYGEEVAAAQRLEALKWNSIIQEQQHEVEAAEKRCLAEQAKANRAEQISQEAAMELKAFRQVKENASAAEQKIQERLELEEQADATRAQQEAARRWAEADEDHEKILMHARQELDNFKAEAKDAEKRASYAASELEAFRTSKASADEGQRELQDHMAAEVTAVNVEAAAIKAGAAEAVLELESVRQAERDSQCAAEAMLQELRSECADGHEAVKSLESRMEEQHSIADLDHVKEAVRVQALQQEARKWSALLQEKEKAAEIECAALEAEIVKERSLLQEQSTEDREKEEQLQQEAQASRQEAAELQKLLRLAHGENTELREALRDLRDEVPTSFTRPLHSAPEPSHAFGSSDRSQSLPGKPLAAGRESISTPPRQPGDIRRLPPQPKVQRRLPSVQ